MCCLCSCRLEPPASRIRRRNQPLTVNGYQRHSRWASLKFKWKCFKVETLVLSICSLCHSEILFFVGPLAKNSASNQLIKGNVSPDKNLIFSYFFFFLANPVKEKQKCNIFIKASIVWTKIFYVYLIKVFMLTSWQMEQLNATAGGDIHFVSELLGSVP